MVLAPVVAFAQPALESLWPNHDGLRWEFGFDYRLIPGFDHQNPDGVEFSSPAWMQLAGHHETPGGTAQVLLAEHALPPGTDAVPVRDPLLRAIWRARPDLRAAIVAQADAGPSAGWWPLFLHDGWFMKQATNIQMWQPLWNHPTWTYLTSDLFVGATFVHQLVPELAANVFLHGTVESIDATVSTPAGMFEHAVKLSYRIDYGWPVSTPDEPRSRAESHGHVHYVPEVGPVDLLEDFLPYFELDCEPNDCPPEWRDLLGVSVQTMTLSLTALPVSIEARTWTQVKNLYH
jgi:hypothetical protein